MFKSMTAYGRAAFQSRIGHFVAEIQSVNRKFLEVNTQIPKELARFDVELKKWILPYVSRGQVTIKIFASFDDMIPVVVRPNIPLAKQLKEAWNRIAYEIGVEESSAFYLTLLSKEDELITFEENLQEEGVYREALKTVFDQALSSFLQMKRNEGAVLEKDALDRLHKIQGWITAIERKAPDATKRYREKLITRLEELLPGNVENEERILREIAIFAERIDIAEEITRFVYHLKHFEELILSDNSSVGKTIEFVLQELGREINTIGSKSSDLEIARYTIDIKSELERIREQIQNVE